MQEIFEEIGEEATDYRVEILGVNWKLSDETNNDLMTAGRDLPWLQDTDEERVQDVFEAVYRDVIILDAWNRPVGPRLNLTQFIDVNGLGHPAVRGAMMELLRMAAEMVDEDEDGIADDWEDRYLGGLADGPLMDSDLDDETNLLEYGLGSHPGEKNSGPRISTGIKEVEGETRFFLSFRRRMGAAGDLRYVLERSDSGEIWEEAGEVLQLDDIENPYDGTGTEIVTFVGAGEAEDGFLYRVRVDLSGNP